MTTHPILPGYYPDPTLCRVADTYWLASSSFEYLPGVPVHRSTDLVTWEQVGHAYERPSSLPLPSGDQGSTGTFAPTIRYHEGTFYLVVTNMGQEPMAQRIVSTSAPSTGWSAPVTVLDTPGIDPDLAWDEEGTCHLTWRGMGMSPQGRFVSTIRSVPVDPASGQRLGTETELWQGTGLADAEAPHLYRRRGWWYLLLAEGGTGLGHCVTMARARELTGPWESCPSNPVLTHRSTEHPVQATGHADLVPTGPSGPTAPDGDWDGESFAMVHLGVRNRGSFPGFHVNGRETFLVGVTWSGDWPVVNEEQYTQALAHREESPDRSFSDDLTGPSGPVAPGDEPWSLHDRWVSPGGLARSALSRDDAGALSITAPHEPESPRPILAVRARDESWCARTELEPVDDAVVELVLYLDPVHHAAVRLEKGAASAVLHIGPLEQQLGQTRPVAAGPVSLWVAVADPDAAPFTQSGPDQVVLGVRQGGTDHELARFDGRYLSTNVAGGFTGRVVGVRALEGRTLVHRFSYESRP